MTNPKSSVCSLHLGAVPLSVNLQCLLLKEKVTVDEDVVGCIKKVHQSLVDGDADGTITEGYTLVCALASSYILVDRKDVAYKSSDMIQFLKEFLLSIFEDSAFYTANKMLDQWMIILVNTVIARGAKIFKALEHLHNKKSEVAIDVGPEDVAVLKLLFTCSSPFCSCIPASWKARIPSLRLYLSMSTVVDLTAVTPVQCSQLWHDVLTSTKGSNSPRSAFEPTTSSSSGSSNNLFNGRNPSQFVTTQVQRNVAASSQSRFPNNISSNNTINFSNDNNSNNQISIEDSQQKVDHAIKVSKLVKFKGILDSRPVGTFLSEIDAICDRRRFTDVEKYFLLVESIEHGLYVRLSGLLTVNADNNYPKAVDQVVKYLVSECGGAGLRVSIAAEAANMKQSHNEPMILFVERVSQWRLKYLASEKSMPDSFFIDVLARGIRDVLTRREVVSQSYDDLGFHDFSRQVIHHDSKVSSVSVSRNAAAVNNIQGTSNLHKTKSDKFCRYFNENKPCPYGPRCNFRHEIDPNKKDVDTNDESSSSADPSSTSNDANSTNSNHQQQNPFRVEFG